jgi:predicted enzyme related to lactoylglutathione lyase
LHSSIVGERLRRIDLMMRVEEMFISLYVNDMERATAFYVDALGATVEFASPTWSSLVIAGIHVSLVLRQHVASPLGLHFIVDDVALACAAVVRAGGQIAAATEASHGTVIAEVSDSEGNELTLRQRRASDTAGVAHEAEAEPSATVPPSHAA